MTNDEVERAIEILLNNQANFDVRLVKLAEQSERTDRQVQETSRQLAVTNMRLEAYAETQAQFIQVVTRHIEAQGEINASLRASLARTDSRLDDLIDIVREGRNGKS
jgi:hypothetical protein